MAKNTTKYVALGGLVLALPFLFGFGGTPPPKKKITPKKKTPAPKPKRPSGHPAPFGAKCYPEDKGGEGLYDKAYWDAGNTKTERARIFEAFEALGYKTPSDRDTMNDLGPDGNLAGDDDVPNSEVKRFQNEYNAVSRSGRVGLLTPSKKMGGLDPDGLVGPCTLNAISLIVEELARDGVGVSNFQEAVQAAKERGFKP